MENDKFVFKLECACSRNRFIFINVLWVQ